LVPGIHRVIPDGRAGMRSQGAAGGHAGEIKFNLKHLCKREARGIHYRHALCIMANCGLTLGFSL